MNINTLHIINKATIQWLRMYRATNFCQLYIFTTGAPVLHAILYWLDAFWWHCSDVCSWCRGVTGWGQEAGVGRGEWSLHHGITADHGHRHHHAWNRGFSEAAKYGCLWTINRQTRSCYGCHHPRMDAVIANNVNHHLHVWLPGPAPCYRCLHYHADTTNMHIVTTYRCCNRHWIADFCVHKDHRIRF